MNWGNAKPGQLCGFDAEGNKIGIDPPRGLPPPNHAPMVVHQGRLYVAIGQAVFVLGDDGVFRPVVFREAP